eukprot:gene35842-44197_t
MKAIEKRPKGWLARYGGDIDESIINQLFRMIQSAKREEINKANMRYPFRLRLHEIKMFVLNSEALTNGGGVGGGGSNISSREGGGVMNFDQVLSNYNNQMSATNSRIGSPAQDLSSLTSGGGGFITQQITSPNSSFTNSGMRGGRVQSPVQFPPTLSSPSGSFRVSSSAGGIRNNTKNTSKPGSSSGHDRVVTSAGLSGRGHHELHHHPPVNFTIPVLQPPHIIGEITSISYDKLIATAAANALAAAGVGHHTSIPSHELHRGSVAVPLSAGLVNHGNPDFVPLSISQRVSLADLTSVTGTGGK